MMTFLERRDDYYVFEAMENYGNFKAGDEIKYRITKCCVPSTELIEGNIFKKGQFIMKKSISVYPDDILSKIFSITDADNTNLGKHLPLCDSWSINKGTISYSDNAMYIDDIKYNLEEDQIYLLPEGFEVDVAQQLCSGVPNMNSLKKKSDALYDDDYGILYAVFYYYIRTIDKFGNFASEPLEMLFKIIVNNGFSVKKAMTNDPELINRLYHGASVRNFTNFVSDVVHGPKDLQGNHTGGVRYRHNRYVEHLIAADEVKASELSAKSKDTSTPTIRKISMSANYEGGLDWKGIFKLMFAEAKGKGGKVKWTWDKVRQNLRTYSGVGKNKKGEDFNRYDSSIVQCREHIKSIPDNDKLVSELENKINELYKELDLYKDDEKTVDITLKQINELESKKNDLVDTDNSKVYEIWNSRLARAKEKYDSLTNKELNSQLTTWLTKGKFGSPLKPYITSTNTYVQLQITISNVVLTEEEDVEVAEINERIKQLQEEQMHLDDNKEDEYEKIKNIEKEIKNLKSKRYKILDATKATGIFNNGTSWLPTILMAGPEN